MDRDQELRKLLNVLHRTGRMAMHSHWTGSGEESVRFSVEQYNRIFNRLGELDPELKTIFAPLELPASMQVVAMACRQVVSYYEDEFRKRGERFAWGSPEIAFGIGAFPGYCGPNMADLDDLGNFIRDWVLGWKSGQREQRKEHCGEAPKPEK